MSGHRALACERVVPSGDAHRSAGTDQPRRRQHLAVEVEEQREPRWAIALRGPHAPRVRDRVPSARERHVPARTVVVRFAEIARPARRPGIPGIALARACHAAALGSRGAGWALADPAVWPEGSWYANARLERFSRTRHRRCVLAAPHTRCRPVAHLVRARRARRTRASIRAGVARQAQAGGSVGAAPALGRRERGACRAARPRRGRRVAPNPALIAGT
eukprot:3936493-Rhodomonas_salina.1